MQHLAIYKVIEIDIKTAIQKGKLKPGDLVPSENELKDEYNVSRMTVRQALNNLVNEGYLYRYKGKGTFVSQMKIEKNIHGVRSFTEEMEAMGRKVSNKVIRFETIPASDEIAEKLFLSKDDEVIIIERLRYGNEIPVLYEELYIPQKLFKTISRKDFDQSFYKYIENTLGFYISHCMQSIEAIKAGSKIPQLLEISKQDPLLLIVRNSFLNNGRPFEYVKSYYRSDQYRFVQYSIKG